jgi:hypothetical protein
MADDGYSARLMSVVGDEGIVSRSSFGKSALV